MTTRKSVTGDNRSEAQKEAQAHNWMIFQLRGMKAAVGKMKVDARLGKTEVENLIKSIEAAIIDLQLQGAK